MRWMNFGISGITIKPATIRKPIFCKERLTAANFRRVALAL